MKILFKNLNKYCGSIGLLPETKDDLWHVYQLIQKGDCIKTATSRKVVLNESSDGSSKSTAKVKTTLNVEIEHIDYETDRDDLRVRGKNIEENEYVKIGSYHTLVIEPNRKFTLTKDEWDRISMGILRMACDPSATADIAAVVMHEGFANICLITPSRTIVKCKLEVSIPRKRKNFAAAHDIFENIYFLHIFSSKALLKFYQQIAQSILNHVDFDVVKVCILASPGFIKEHLYDNMMKLAVKDPQHFKQLVSHKNKFILVHSSNGFKSALNEVLKDPSVIKQMSETKAVQQVKDITEFYDLLYKEPSKALYGSVEHIEKAVNASAIKVLMITDDFLRKASVQVRRRISDIIDIVKSVNGQYRLFSILHSSGEQLNQLGGFAAILRFPMPELVDQQQSDNDEDEFKFID